MKHTIAAAVGAAVLALGCAATPAAQAAEPLPRITPADAGFSAAGLERLDKFFAREIEAKRVPGAVVAIARDGKLVYYRSFGYLDAEARTPMPLDAIFGLASMTKILASVGALQLTENGQLPLKSRLDEYYPGFGQMKVGTALPDGTVKLDAQTRPIYIQDLFRHTSGLTYGGRGNADAVSRQYPDGTKLAFEGDTANFINTLTRLPLVHQPGKQFEYSFSTDVLGAVVEKVSGRRLGDQLQATVFAPLGMTDTTFRLTDAIKPRIARPFKANPLDGKPQAIGTIDKPTTFDCGGACAMGTVGDYLRFGQMLMNGGELDGKRLLSSQTVAHMTSNHLGPEIVNRVGAVEPHREGFGFGLGVAVRTQAGLSAVPGNPGEYTWNGAYGTAFFADPKEKLVVVHGTAAPGDLRKYYREQVQTIVYGAMTR